MAGTSNKLPIALALVFGLFAGCCGGFGLGILSTKGGAKFVADVVSSEEKADVRDVKSISREKFRVDYPGNWAIDDSDEDYDPDHLFSIDSPGSCHVQFVVFDTATDPQGSIDAQVGAFVPKIVKDPRQTTFREWGSFSGSGVKLEGKILGVGDGVIQIFSTSSEEKDVTVTVVEFCFSEDLASVTPGFELVRKTFELK